MSDLSIADNPRDLRLSRDRISPDHCGEIHLVKASKGTIVFPKSGAAIATNNRGVLGADGYIVSHLMALEVDPKKAISQWLYWVMRQIDMMMYSNNDGYPSLRKSAVEGIRIHLPPLPEQKRIVAKLEWQMAAVERARQAAERRRAEIDLLSAALMRESMGP